MRLRHLRTFRPRVPLLYVVAVYMWTQPDVLAQNFESFAQQTQGVGTAFIQVRVVSPSQTTGNNYEVTFTQQDEEYLYTIENLTTEAIVAENVPVDNVTMFEGIEVSIDVPSGPQILDIQEVEYGNNLVEPPVHVFRPGDRQGEGGNNSTDEYTFVSSTPPGDIFQITRTEAKLGFNDFEIRFEENPEGRNKILYIFDFEGGGTYNAPFSAWNIGSAVDNDPEDDRQLLVFAYDGAGNNNPPVFDGGAPPADGGPGTMYDSIYLYEIETDNFPEGDINGDGVVDYDDFLTDLDHYGGDLSAHLPFRPYLDRYDSEVLARLGMVSVSGDPNYLPPPGTTIRITTTKPLSESDVYEFSTSKFELYTTPVIIEFGDIQIGSSETVQMVVHNGSDRTLSVSNISVTSAQLHPSLTSLSLPAGGSRNLTLTYTPTTVTILEDTLTITSDDVYFPQYRVAITGEGLPEPTGILGAIGHLDIPGSVTDIWGYFDETTGREYAIVGNYDAVNLVEVTQPNRPRLASRVSVIGALTVPGFDMKTWGHYLYSVTGSSGPNQGVILDIRDPENPELAGQFDSSHNLFITDDGIMILESPGWRIFDLTQDPTEPKLLASGGTSGHDAAVIDGRFYDFHARDGTHIYDFSDPANPQLLTSITDPSIQYHHSGWTTEDGNYLFICDELANDPQPDVIVYDIRDLDNPQRVGEFSDPNATVHNLVIIGEYAFASYYSAGFRVFDISDPTDPQLAAEFDTAPEADGENLAGAWGVYPFALSGNVYVSDRSNGLYIFRIEGFTTSVEEKPPQVPAEIVLHGNYPNPFNPETKVSYMLPTTATVKITIYNTLGQLVRTLVNEEQVAGAHTARWDGTNDAGHQVPSGIYFYQLTAGDFTQTRRMLLLR